MLLNTSLFFKSKVSRRIFVLFIFSAMLPITALAILSFTHVFKQLNEQSYRRLHQASKVLGMAIIERLSFLEAELDLIASGLRAKSGVSPVKEIDRRSERLGKRFRAISLVKRTGVEVVYGDTLRPFELNQTEMAHLRTGRAAILERHGQRRQPQICMVKAVNPNDLKQGLLWAEMNTLYLWGIAESDTLSSMTEISVLDSMNNVIYTSIPLAPSFLQKLGEELVHSPAGRFEWGNAHEKYLASYWSTFLKYAFATRKWTVVLSSSKPDVLLPVTKFRKTFLLVLMVAFFTVLLLSSLQIRRSLVPLEKLRAGTRHIARGDFDKKVALRTGDEFEELAESFNDMGATLNAQFNALNTMAEIDRAILSSLDSKGIVGTILSRVGDFFSYHYCSITLVDSDKGRNAQTYVGGQIPGEVEVAQVSHITTLDLKLFRENSEWFVIESEDELPAYLAGQTIPAIKSFLILPIFLNKTLAGIITFGSQANSHFIQEEIVRARQMADQVAVALTNAHLLEELEELNVGTLTALARAVDAKSPWTSGHSERVTEIGLKIGSRLGLSEEEQERLRRGGLLHDIGKIGIPARILDKPGKLTDAEYKVIREHTTIGARILEPIKAYADVVAVVRQHHERLSGEGYPDGLSGEEISLEARILAVADVFDALISERPYRPGMKRGEAIQLIKQENGRHFDQNVVAAFLAIIGMDGADGEVSGSKADVADMEILEIIGHKSRRISP